MMKLFFCIIAAACLCSPTQAAGNRRVRHLNPASAGAVIALDSRFVTSLANGDPVDTWASRRPATVDATGTGSARPLWTAGLQGGQPGMVFDGSNDQLISNQVLDDEELTVIVCFWRGGVVGTGNRDLWGTRDATGEGRIVRTQLTLRILQLGGYATQEITYTEGIPYIHTARFSVSEGYTKGWLNGSVGSPVEYGLVPSEAPWRIGYAGPSGGLFFLGRTFAAAAFQSALTPAIRRRIEQSMAFSFRIPIQ